jgi:hypothetical protein
MEKYRWLEAIIGKLSSSHATSLTDSELDRILLPCVCGPRLVPLAKKYRDEGVLKLTDIKWKKDLEKKRNCSTCIGSSPNHEICNSCENYNAWEEAPAEIRENGEHVLTTTQGEKCLCLSCSRLLSNGGTCQPNTNSHVTACGGYSGTSAVA